MEATRRFRWMAALAAVLGVAGLALDLPAALFAALSVGVFLLVQWTAALADLARVAAGLSVERTASRRILRQGMELEVAARITAPPARGHVRVRDLIPAGTVAVSGETAGVPGEALSYRLQVAARGDLSFAGVEVTLETPFSILSLTRPAPGPVLVVQPLHRFAPLRAGGTVGDIVSVRRPAARGTDLYSVREYVPGDDLRRIDWKLLARHGRVYVRQFEEQRAVPRLVIVDLPAADGPGFSTLLGAAAGMLEEIVRQARTASLLVISGAQVIEYHPDERSAHRLARILRGLGPVERSVHLYRAYSRGALAVDAARVREQASPSAREFLDRVADLRSAPAPPSTFEVQVTRVLAGLRSGDGGTLYSLCTGDTSHLHQVVEAGRNLRRPVTIRIPREAWSPALTGLFAEVI
ncbi:MAG: DUF58 domain-containing protein [Methanomicrobiales archaeon]